MTLLAMERLGTSSYSDAARRIGLGLHADKNVKRWATGGGSPDFEKTLLLLQAAGLLREEPAARAGGTAEDPIETRLRSLEDRVAESVRLTKEALRLLREAPPRADGAPRARSRAKRPTGTDG